MQNDDKEPQGNGNAWMKNMLVVFAIVGALFLFVSLFDGGMRDSRAGDTIAYSDFLAKVDDGSIKDVVIADNVISGKIGKRPSRMTCPTWAIVASVFSTGSPMKATPWIGTPRERKASMESSV